MFIFLLEELGSFSDIAVEGEDLKLDGFQVAIEEESFRT
jgi:hypothetical protein